MRCRNGSYQCTTSRRRRLVPHHAGPRAAIPTEHELLPAGPEKEKMVKLCVGCHEIDLVVARRHTREEWDGVVEDMIARGSKGTEEELSDVAEYLSKYLGKVERQHGDGQGNSGRRSSYRTRMRRRSSPGANSTASSRTSRKCARCRDWMPAKIRATSAAGCRLSKLSFRKQRGDR